MTLEGSLREIPLLDVLQLVAVARETGTFELANGPRQGSIFVRDGRIVDAAAGPLQAEEAIYELAQWTQGTFAFSPGPVERIRRIERSLESLLNNASRRADGWRRLRPEIGPTDAVPVFGEHDPVSPVRLTPPEWRLVRNIDRKRSVAEVAGVAGMNTYDACRILRRLISEGLVKLEGPGAASQVAGPSNDRPERISRPSRPRAGEPVSA